VLSCLSCLGVGIYIGGVHDLDDLDNWQLEEDAYNCTVAQYWAKAARYFEKAIAEDKADPFEDEDEAICAIADMAVEMGRKFHQNQLAEY
ncbi:hypothetical protein, partial [Kingella kingae]|uniref:hypothetical protein n=1 Tax=Kingella kingae TaxID=504 RepID=UPI0032B3CC04